MVLTVEAFIAENAGKTYARSWVFEPGIKVYLRIGRRLIKDETLLSLEIANVEVDEAERRQGKCKALLQRAALSLFERPERWCLFAENVLNPDLAAYFQREGWTRREAYARDPWPSFYARPAVVVLR